MRYDDNWLADEWIKINAGGIVTELQVAEMKGVIMAGMLNGSINWSYGCSLRNNLDNLLEQCQKQ